MRGAVAGALGTWLMDLVTTGLAASQSKASMQQEREATPNDKSSVENLIDRVEATTGIVLNPDQRSIATQAVHLASGSAPARCTERSAIGCRSWAQAGACCTA